MYKLYVNDRPLFLADKSEETPENLSKNHLRVHYPGKSKFLFNYIDMMEKKPTYDAVIIETDDLPALKQDLKLIARPIKAGGGVVINDEGLLLAIFRRGFWDIPKGKRDPGESMRACALREVEEETGVQNLQIVKKLGKTRHLYRLADGQRVLKISKWFLMHCPNQKIVVQTEEDITKGIWVPVEDFRGPEFDIYPNIEDFLVEKKEDILGLSLRYMT